MKGLKKSYKGFFTLMMSVYLSTYNRLTFLQMARETSSCESRFRQNCKKDFDWLEFNANAYLTSIYNRLRSAIAIDPSFLHNSGIKTIGVGKFWSGCDSDVKRGLEFFTVAFVDADANTAIALFAVQTIKEEAAGLTDLPDYICQCEHGLIKLYLKALYEQKDRLLEINERIVADSYFAVKPFVSGVNAMGFDLISRLHDNAVMRYLCTDKPTGRRGRPKLYEGKVNLNALDENVFETQHLIINDKQVTLQSAVVNVKSFNRNCKVVIVTYHDTKKKKQVRKIYFSTNITMSAIDIFDIYRTRFQIEFLFRDAKEYMGLEHCQARSKEALNFCYNMSLASVNMARDIARQWEKESGTRLSVGDVKIIMHNMALYQRIRIKLGFPNLTNPNNNSDTEWATLNDLLLFGVKAAA